jgi:radical SAM superfamily enzyme YgiQ (UPF0313 family)
MRPSVLLINPPWYRFFGGEFSTFPLGICYLAGVLEKYGYDVSIYNADFQAGFGVYKRWRISYDYGYLDFLKDDSAPIWKEIEGVITQHSPDVVGITATTAKFGSALKVAGIAKKINPECKVVLGGVHPTLLPEESVRNEHIDIAVQGEGEYTLLEIMKKIDKISDDGKLQETLREVKGITYKVKHNGGFKIIRNPRRSLIENLDELPFPARHLIYEKEKYPPYSFGNIFASRGCPYSCIFCSSHYMWYKRVRYRSPENIIAEIKHVQNKYRTNWFIFEDDTFTLKKSFVEAICDGILSEHLDIEWLCETRADMLSHELVRKMKKAGCKAVSIGVESGDEYTLRRIKKGITLKDIRKAKRILKENEIELRAFFMIGFPWETRAGIYKTVALMKELDPAIAVLSIVTPYPGTELYALCEAEKLLPTKIDWDTFFHQSAKMFLTNKFTRAEVTEIIREASEEFIKHNRRKALGYFITHPFYMFKRFMHERYYIPERLLRRLRVSPIR